MPIRAEDRTVARLPAPPVTAPEQSQPKVTVPNQNPTPAERAEEGGSWGNLLVPPR